MLLYRQGYQKNRGAQTTEDSRAAVACTEEIIMLEKETFFRLEKIDPFQGIATGVAAAEELDRDNEIFDYAASKPFFMAWSNGVKKDSRGLSVGNVRFQHDDKRPVGRLLDIQFDDARKQVRVSAKIEEAEAKSLLQTGVLTGFSIGGKYVKRVQLPSGVVKYTADPAEISVCDRPCGPSATFSTVKSDGSLELRKFVTRSEVNMGFDERRAEQLLLMGLDLGTIGQMIGKSTGMMQMWYRDRLRKFNLLYERDWRGEALESGDSVVKARPDTKIKRTRKSNEQLANEGKAEMEARIHDLITACVEGAHAQVNAAAKAARYPSFWQRQDEALKKRCA
jgi:hypothetical protein